MHCHLLHTHKQIIRAVLSTLACLLSARFFAQNLFQIALRHHDYVIYGSRVEVHVIEELTLVLKLFDYSWNSNSASLKIVFL